MLTMVNMKGPTRVFLEITTHITMFIQKRKCIMTFCVCKQSTSCLAHPLPLLRIIRNACVRNANVVLNKRQGWTCIFKCKKYIKFRILTNLLKLEIFSRVGVFFGARVFLAGAKGEKRCFLLN